MNENELYVVEPRFKSLGEYEAFARQTMDKHGLVDWELKFNKRKSLCGFCSGRKKVISLSIPYIDKHLGAIGDDLRDTVLHEIAHALNCLAGTNDHHGPCWKKWCEKLGAFPKYRFRKPKYGLLYGKYDVVGEFHQLPLFADKLDVAMLRGRVETLGKLWIGVWDGDNYVAADKFKRDVRLLECEIHSMSVVSLGAEGRTVLPIVIEQEVLPVLREQLFSDFRHERLYSFGSDMPHSLRRPVRALFCGDFHEGNAGNVKAMVVAWLDVAGIAADTVYVAQLRDCIVGVERVNAVGIFAVVEEDVLRPVVNGGGVLAMSSQKVNRVVAGCLVFDCKDGLVVSYFNQQHRRVPAGLEPLLMIDDLAKSVVDGVNGFMKEMMTEDSDNDVGEKCLDVLQNTRDYFDNYQQFDKDEFVSHVLPDLGMAHELNEHLDKSLEGMKGAVIPRQVARTALRRLGSVIKLGDGFELRVTAASDGCIRRGFDEASGMHSCEIFYEEK